MFLPPRELGCTRIRSSEFIGSDFFPFLSISSRSRVHGLTSSPNVGYVLQLLLRWRGQQQIPTIRLKNMLLMTKMKAKHASHLQQYQERKKKAQPFFFLLARCS
uniref:Uncharacterized protein n=1 Tax=Oryza glumipatula TaxID=40148 RepID=A0A0E0AMQ7_9ORYZ